MRVIHDVNLQSADISDFGVQSLATESR